MCLIPCRGGTNGQNGSNGEGSSGAPCRDAHQQLAGHAPRSDREHRQLRKFVGAPSARSSVASEESARAPYIAGSFAPAPPSMITEGDGKYVDMTSVRTASSIASCFPPSRLSWVPEGVQRKAAVQPNSDIISVREVSGLMPSPPPCLSVSVAQRRSSPDS